VTRKRPSYIFAMLGVIGLGLASRRFPGLFPSALGKYPGDALWALMVFIGWGIVFPTGSTFRILIYAVATACLVEFLKLSQATWLAWLRDTTLGRLAFGSTFSWNNLVAYAVGTGAGALGELVMRARRR
jgi:hypothetical protein